MSARTYRFGRGRWRGECIMAAGKWWEQILQYCYAFLLTILVFGGIYGTGETTDPAIVAGMVLAGVVGIVMVFGIRLERLQVGPVNIEFRKREEGQSRTERATDWQEENR